MQNKYKVSTWHNGQPAIFTDRGLVCLMEAGNQLTREKDAAEIVAILNAAPDLLAALKLALPCVEYAEIETASKGQNEAHNKCLTALEWIRAALAKAEGAQ